MIDFYFWISVFLLVYYLISGIYVLKTPRGKPGLPNWLILMNVILAFSWFGYVFTVGLPGVEEGVKLWLMISV